MKNEDIKYSCYDSEVASKANEEAKKQAETRSTLLNTIISAINGKEKKEEE